MKKKILYGFIFLLVIFVLLQLIPLGRDHANPPVVKEIAWQNSAARALAVSACYDCHSNETVWPWYSKIAPISWMITSHVEEGRGRLNFSNWGSGRSEDEVGEVIFEGEMPPAYYLLMHASARLSDNEKQTLVDGINAAAGK